VLVEAADTAAALPRGLGVWLDLNPSSGSDPAIAEGAFDRTGCLPADLDAIISAAISETGCCVRRARSFKCTLMRKSTVEKLATTHLTCQCRLTGQ
jgi:hypothetical protein